MSDTHLNTIIGADTYTDIRKQKNADINILTDKLVYIECLFI